MGTIGLFYASETGNTRKIAKQIAREHFDPGVIDLHAVEKANAEMVAGYPALIIGTPTVADGEFPEGLATLLSELDGVDFAGKRVALFGLGDQFSYPKEFADALGMLYQDLEARGARLVGHWPTAGYDYERSKADRGDGRFCGLVLDQDNQAEETPERLTTWINGIRAELLPNA